MGTVDLILDKIMILINGSSLLDISVLSINIILMLFSKFIITKVSQETTPDRIKINRIHILRAMNLFMIIALGYYHFYSPVADNSIAFKLISVSMLIYCSYLLVHISSFFIRNKYGKSKEIDGETIRIETYNSRLLSIFSAVFIAIISLISIIQVLEFDSLLEAGGVIGFIGVFFALTQNAWAPDIFSGLIILNSGMVEEGDVVEINSDISSIIGVIFKTKVFHTEILNIVNNHRIMIKNSKLRSSTIHNLSKFASARGLRENIHFKIGYDVATDKVKAMFNSAYETAKENPDVTVEPQFPLEIGIIDTGDHAVEWSVYYYTKDIKNLIKTRQLMREHILHSAIENNISLATPQTISVTKL